MTSHDQSVVLGSLIWAVTIVVLAAFATWYATRRR